MHSSIYWKSYYCLPTSKIFLLGSSAEQNKDEWTRLKNLATKKDYLCKKSAV